MKEEAKYKTDGIHTLSLTDNMDNLLVHSDEHFVSCLETKCLPQWNKVFYTSKQTVLCVEINGFIGGKQQFSAGRMSFSDFTRHFFSL